MDDTEPSREEYRDFHRVYLELLRENYAMAQDYRNMAENYLQMCNNYWVFVQRQQRIINRLVEQLRSHSQDTNTEESREIPRTDNLAGLLRGRIPPIQTVYSLTPAFSRRGGFSRNLGRISRNSFFNSGVESNEESTLAISNAEIMNLFRNILSISRETEENGDHPPPTREYSVTDISNTIYDASLIRDTMCPIGLEDFVEGEEISIICGCGHSFKKENLERWLRRNHCCPICRYDIDRRQPAGDNDADTGMQGVMEFIFNIDLSGNVLPGESSNASSMQTLLNRLGLGNLHH